MRVVIHAWNPFLAEKFLVGWIDLILKSTHHGVQLPRVQVYPLLHPEVNLFRSVPQHSCYTAGVIGIYIEFVKIQGIADTVRHRSDGGLQGDTGFPFISFSQVDQVRAGNHGVLKDCQSFINFFTCLGSFILWEDKWSGKFGYFRHSGLGCYHDRFLGSHVGGKQTCCTSCQIENSSTKNKQAAGYQ